MLVHRIRSLIGAGVVALVCGFATVSPASAATHRSHHSSHHARHHRSGGIPQHNGGDRDGDNNGAPSDGDGGV
jgi:hypothetical protein